MSDPAQPSADQPSAKLSRLGKYQLIALIGQGGMASVYRAEIVGPGEARKSVAIKVIRENLSRQRSFTLMFLDEVRVAMGLSHRNIVQTFDADQWDETYFLVMELVDGPTVADLMESLGRTGRRLPYDLSLFIGMEISSALSYAHAQGAGAETGTGLIHRDVTPSNILLSRSGEVKLADFGIAKASVGRFAVTQRDVLKGKLNYMAPEQARGEACTASDVFALGATLYEMLLGRCLRPQVTLDDVRRWAAPGELSHRGAADLGPALDLVRRCVDSDPARRPSAEALRKALLGCLRRMEVGLADDTDPHERLRHFLRQVCPPVKEDQAQRLGALLRQQVRLIPTAAEKRSLLASDAALQSPQTPATVALGPAHDAPSQTKALPSSDGKVRGVIHRRGRWVIGGGLVLLALVLFGALRWRETEKRSPAVAARAKGPQHRFGVAGDGGPDGVAEGPTVTRDQRFFDGGARSTGRQQRAPRPSVRPPRRRDSVRRTRRAARLSDLRRFGQLNLNAEPWAYVYVDGVLRGATPIQGLRLSAGRHVLRLVAHGGAGEKRLVVAIPAGGSLRRVVVFE